MKYSWMMALVMALALSPLFPVNAQEPEAGDGGEAATTPADPTGSVPDGGGETTPGSDGAPVNLALTETVVQDKVTPELIKADDSTGGGDDGDPAPGESSPSGGKGGGFGDLVAGGNPQPPTWGPFKPLENATPGGIKKIHEKQYEKLDPLKGVLGGGGQPKPTPPPAPKPTKSLWKPWTWFN